MPFKLRFLFNRVTNCRPCSRMYFKRALAYQESNRLEARPHSCRARSCLPCFSLPREVKTYRHAEGAMGPQQHPLYPQDEASGFAVLLKMQPGPVVNFCRVVWSRIRHPPFWTSGVDPCNKRLRASWEMPSTASARPTQVLFETETNKAYFTTGAGLISILLCEQEALFYRNICPCVTSECIKAFRDVQGRMSHSANHRGSPPCGDEPRRP